MDEFWKYIIVAQNIVLLYVAWKQFKTELRQKGLELINSMIISILAPVLGEKLGRGEGIKEKIDQLNRNNEENSKNRVDH